MSGNLTTLFATATNRPLLMRPQEALAIATRLREVDSRAFERPGALGGLLRLLGRSQRPAAMDDADDYRPEPIEQRLAYSPLYVGEPEDVGFCWSLHDGVAMMQVNTALTDRGSEYCGEVYHGYDTLLAGLREASADPRVKAIFIREFSPGGVVAGGLDAISTWMLANRAAAGGKPIWVYADMAASAAYWIASCADRIVASRFGIIGSIGAVIVHENYGEALKKYGLDITAIEFPEGKTDGAWWKALSPAAKARWESDIRQCGLNFFATVQAGRPHLTADKLEALGADCFMGDHDDPQQSALGLGLIDALATEEDAFAELKALVAEPVSAPPQTGQSRAAATGERGAQTPTQEKPMAQAAQTPPGRSAALQQAEARLAEAQADLERVRAESEDMPAEGGDGEDEGDGEMPEPDAEAGAAPETDDEAEASAIAASAEAQAEPALALAAIQSGQTLAQFKASVRALGQRGKGQLTGVMQGAQRLGADGKAPPAAAAGLNASEIYGRRKAKAAGKSAA